MSEYKPTIGLEIHAQLKTRTKMFCNSKNDPDETRPNVNICPICMGHPGTLPVMNKEAVRHVLKVGVAVGGTRADFTEFDRKNYFYPDIPKGYQISQYKYPLVTGGSLVIPGTERKITFTRIHLEEDTALSKHEGDHSLIDFNRAGIPLMELVTEPVIHSAEDAVAFAKEFQLLLRYLGVSDANMEKGELRLEANVSVSKTDEFGTKTEIKNLNSFRSVERAIAYEIKRQVGVLESGGVVVQETRGWDEDRQETFSQRTKESSHDYRYFPEPDLPKLKLSEIPEFAEETLKKELPELPWQRRELYKTKPYEGLSDETIEVLVNTFVPTTEGEVLLAEYYDRVTKHTTKWKLAANYLTSDALGILAGEPEWVLPRPEWFTDLIEMVGDGLLSSRGAKDVLAIMLEKEATPKEIAEREGLLQKSDEGELKKIAEQVVKDNPDAATEYKAGKGASLQYLIGQGMKLSKGSANPQVLQKLFKKLLE
ncbi:Asp-tRNA(Asn)/Glu-tRNA(Gln) amidotransferase subunit GatB [Candidatus Wolfebacteria bacterium]|nr:Asp-tRNA(Asn)/Glu-tRNA(Gln) amidotransferase subunit GatB [Candidatus Wolfebacteria bacterium]